MVWSSPATPPPPQDLWVVWNVPLPGAVRLRPARSTGFAVQLFLVSRVSLQQQAAASPRWGGALGMARGGWAAASTAPAGNLQHSSAQSSRSPGRVHTEFPSQARV